METGAMAQIGFLGLGVMGAPMVVNLAKAGYEVFVFDVAADVAADVASKHTRVHLCASPSEVGRNSKVVVTMLPNGRVVRDVVFQAGGLAEGMAKGTLLIDTSSAEPWLTRETAQRLAEQGVAMVDAPVSGASTGAQAGELVFMVGGADADVKIAKPVLSAMGTSIFHLGPIGSGHTMKCLNNLVTAITLQATAEGLAIGTKAGLDPAVMTDVINKSTGESWISRTHIHQRVLSRTFDDPFKLELMLKDIGIAMNLARDMGTPAPISGLGHQLWQAAHLEQGVGASVSTVVKSIEHMMRTEIRSTSQR